MRLFLPSVLVLFAACTLFGQANPSGAPAPLTDDKGKPLGYASSLQFEYPAPGAVPRSLRSKLGDVMNIADFGAKCDGVSDDFPSIQAAIRAAAALSGTSLVFPLTGHACGIKHSVDLPSGVIFRGQGPSNNSGLAALPGGTWSTYADDRGSTPRTYMVSIGGGNTVPGCKTPAVPYADYRDMIVSANHMVQVAMLNQCGEEQSGFHNILTGGATYAQVVIQTSGAENSNYDNLNIFPLRGTYGITTDANSRVSFSHMTINGGDSDGILVYGQVTNINNVHCEHVDSCIHIISGGGAYMSNIDSGPFVKTASVVIGRNTFGAIINVMTGQNPGGTVPFVKDELMRGGATLNNYGAIGYYYSSVSNYGHLIGQLITSDPQIPWILPSDLGVPAIKSNSGLRYVCVDTTGRLASHPPPWGET